LISVPATVAPGRAGLVVGRKALPRAVDRNRLKRLLREMLRAARPQACALDLVIRVKRPLRQADLRPAAEEAGALLARILATSSTR
jgi:ribonuclease P protein component